MVSALQSPDAHALLRRCLPSAHVAQPRSGFAAACGRHASQARLAARLHLARHAPTPSAAQPVGTRISTPHKSQGSSQLPASCRLPLLDSDFRPRRVGSLKPLWRRGTARPGPSRSPMWSGLSFWSRIPQRGIPTQAGKPMRRRRVPHRGKPRKDRKTAVTATDQLAIRQPAGEPSHAVPGPLGPLLRRSSPCGMVAFRGAEARQDRQAPHRTGPRALGQHQTTEPTPATGFDTMRLTRPHRVAVETLRGDFLAASSLDRVIQSTAQLPCWGKARDQHTQQAWTRGQGRPARTMQDPVRVAKTFRLAPPHDPPARSHRAVARG
jgi:hypothetical protein